MTATRDHIAIYIQVAPFPHSSALLFGLSGMFLVHMAIRQLARRHYCMGIGLAIASLPALGIALFAEADARSRYQEYKRIRAVLVRRGWNKKIIDPVSYSRCQRDTAVVAATRAGYKAEITRYFHQKGYRWYHIVPDALLKNPSYMFSRQFIRSSFFVKEYRVRVSTAK